MKSPLIILAVLVILALTGFGIYSFSQKNDTSSEDITTDQIQGSRYVEYSKATFDQAVSKRRVLFFYANWCPTCRPADASFRENANKIPEGTTLIRVNYNDTQTDQEEKDLANKYGVTYQHTFVQVGASGNQITKWSGGGVKELTANIK